MSKKIYIPMVTALVVTLIAGLWVSNVAFAQDDQPAKRPQRVRRAVAQVIVISDDQFTVQKPNGDEHIILVDENTHFRDREGVELAFGDLSAGQWVLVLAFRDDQGAWVARSVVFLPEDFDPAKQTGARGRVAGVDTVASTFVLHTRRGEVTLTVDETTRFLGAAESVVGLREGMIAAVVAQKQGDESLLAEVVRARIPLQRYVGQITVVDTEACTFTLYTRRGDMDLTFTVDENTRFRGQEGTLESLADLQPEMVGLVVAKLQDDGSLMAIVVAATTREQLSKFGQRVSGRIVSVDEESFTLEARTGEQYTFRVTEDTRFRSRGGQVQSLSDLQERMVLVVGGEDLGDGQYQALLVIVGRW